LSVTSRDVVFSMGSDLEEVALEMLAITDVFLLCGISHGVSFVAHSFDAKASAHISCFPGSQHFYGLGFQ
jgi:hypothetical protein